MTHIDPEVAVELALQRYRELRRQAEAERVARRLAKQNHSGGQTLRQKLGEGLIAIGQLLAPQTFSPARQSSMQADLAEHRCKSLVPGRIRAATDAQADDHVRQLLSSNL